MIPCRRATFLEKLKKDAHHGRSRGVYKRAFMVAIFNMGQPCDHGLFFRIMRGALGTMDPGCKKAR